MKPATRRLLLLLLTAAALAAGGGTYLLQRGKGSPAAFRTTPIRREALVVTIGATGTLQPEEVVNVGAQIAGQIVAFGTDAHGRSIDYGLEVEVGMVLAQIDPLLYQSEAAQAAAQAASAAAGVTRAEADLEQLKAKLEQAGRDWERAKTLGPSEALSQASFDAYRAAFDTARANLAVGQAAILQARAARDQAQAGLAKARRNLDYCTIKSPVKGVIIDRRVNIGQTVVASLNAPSLFLIAKDLRRMQLWVAVNEADIGKIRPGQPVRFTVDAFPGERFAGTVGKVRLNASMTQNVVTYTVEVLTDNADGRLLPYLTANVQFEIDRLEDALLVPNGALRFNPEPEEIDPGAVDAGRTPGAPRSSAATAAGEGQGKRKGGGEATLWLGPGPKLKPLQVRVGQSDGASTAVEGPALAEGLEVVMGRQPAAARGGETTNPFTPKIPRGRPPGR
jgi:HlyD family secretion protein